MIPLSSIFKYQLSIKQKILLLVAVPVIVLTTAFVIFHIITRTNDAEHELNRQGTLLTQYLAESSELALFAGDMQVLETLATQILKTENVLALSIYNQQQEIVLQRGDHNLPLIDSSVHVQSGQAGISRIFQLPVLSRNIKLGDFDLADQESGNNSSQTTLGWVQLALDDTSLKVRQKEIILKDLTISLSDV